MNPRLEKFAIPALRWTLGLAILWESYRFSVSNSAAHFLAKVGLPHWVAPVLGGSEIVGAILFLIPAATVVGGYSLLFIFAVAAIVHFSTARLTSAACLSTPWPSSFASASVPWNEPRRAMTDEEFIASFENCTLPNGSFHHSDHVHMAFLYLCRYPALEALQRFSASLTRFAAAHGKPDLYNETVTWAFLLLIRERMVRAGYEQTWLQFAAGNSDLLQWKDNVLKKYYREETLRSDLAKRTFLFPDKTIPLPQ